MPASPSKAKVRQLQFDQGGTLYALFEDGRIFRYTRDPAFINQPGVHMKWFEVPGHDVPMVQISFSHDHVLYGLSADGRVFTYQRDPATAGQPGVHMKWSSVPVPE